MVVKFYVNAKDRFGEKQELGSEARPECIFYYVSLKILPKPMFRW